MLVNLTLVEFICSSHVLINYLVHEQKLQCNAFFAETLSCCKILDNQPYQKYANLKAIS